MRWWEWVLVVVVLALVVVSVYDLTQRRHAILRNFPIVGHLRYLLEGIGPEIRQYIVTDNDSDRPFSRDHRRWVYTSAKKVNTYFGFGTDNDLERSPNYLVVKQASFPLEEAAGRFAGWTALLPAALRQGAGRSRAAEQARTACRRP